MRKVNRIRRIAGELLEMILGAESSDDVVIIETENWILAVNANNTDENWNQIGAALGTKLGD